MQKAPCGAVAVVAEVIAEHDGSADEAAEALVNTLFRVIVTALPERAVPPLSDGLAVSLSADIAAVSEKRWSSRRRCYEAL